MKKKGIVGIFTSGAVLAGLIAATAIPAAAMVISTGYSNDDIADPVIVQAPSDVSLNEYQSSDEIRVFNEKQNIYVENLDTADGQITGFVDSHLIHQDSDGSEFMHGQGSITFGNEIIGVIISDAGLDSSDRILGLGDVTYPGSLTYRGLESNDSYVIDGNTIEVDLYSSSWLDQIRVLTKPGIAVDIDIKPGSETNSINNNGKGVIPVAIIGSEAFDVSQIDPSTVELEGMGIKMTGKTNKLLAHIEDVNSDGIDDLMIQIQDVRDTFTADDTDATLTGNLFDGTPIEGVDFIRLVPDKV